MVKHYEKKETHVCCGDGTTIIQDCGQNIMLYVLNTCSFCCALINASMMLCFKNKGTTVTCQWQECILINVLVGDSVAMETSQNVLTQTMMTMTSLGDVIL